MRVIVVGAGILGASAAYHLAAGGAEVVILDPMLEGRATAAGAGIVCPWSSRVTDPDWYRLSGGGARDYPMLVVQLAEDGETDLGYRRVGALCIAGDEGGLDETEARIRARMAEAPEAGALSRLPPAEARALFPPLRPEEPALHLSGAARVDGRLLAAALLRAAQRRGAVAHRDVVVGLLAEGGRVRGARTAGGVFEGDAVLLAAGAWAPPLLAPLGLELAVQPQRGQILHLLLPGQQTRDWPVLLPMSHHYLLAFDDSRVVVGATRELGSGFDHRLTAGGVMQVLRQALDVAPGLAGATLHEMRIGMRPMGPDLKPLLGPVPGVEGLVIGNGLGAGGLTMGPYAGRLLAQHLLRGAAEISLAPYDPRRG
ncbi:FAD-dependent oxidoreductase [Pseudoroseomonas rhizosphaerae]|uniref:FAD-dependent oxidoreductase n=1 Tax=Teichococcus rhizosphaerae TaxID=1335062 RepID=A0A2C7A9X8_9PROT|nr:FAD-binding oxidoreductase [Pseudoroseomonas rhizosphaerae]PHK95190.1 FAD-dependent oxidoreductase [Pseudoroseomonas rhizosphaerae]